MKFASLLLTLLCLSSSALAQKTPMPASESIASGDIVRVRSVPETEAIGIAGLVGQVSFETRPSIIRGTRGVPAAIGHTLGDRILSVFFEGRTDMDGRSTLHLVPELLELIDNAPRQACTQRGGQFEPVCMRGTFQCIMPYSDGGKPCTDSSQCEADCILYGMYRKEAPSQPVIGECRSTNYPCGCFAIVKDGQLALDVCID